MRTTIYKIERIMRKIGKIYCYVFLSLFIFSCKQKEFVSSVQIKKLDYPSASSVEYYSSKLYVMGDDATNLLVLDTTLNLLDSIPIVSYPGRRIPKDIKPDLEASAIISNQSSTALFLLGSGSVSPQRNSGWRYLLESKTLDSLQSGAGYELIKQSGIKQLNIEGACFIGDSLILANRGNKSYPKNHLIITDENFWRQLDSSFQIKEIITGENDTSSFKGISGLCYSKLNDQLIMTVSTEDTKSAYEDGTIGKSYLWIINNISTKLNSKPISVDRIIDLEEIDPRFKAQKIEEAAVIEETKNIIRLTLVADNDDGSSSIFKMSIKNN